MAGRNLTLMALRALDTRLQHLAGFVHRQVQQIENRAGPTDSPAFEPPDPGLSQSRPGGPPAHWLARVRQGAPGYLDPAASAQESARPLGFKAGAGSEEVINPPANSNPVGEENPVEDIRGNSFSTENKESSEPAPKFSFRAAHRAKPMEKVPSDDKKGGADSREGESVVGNPEPRSKRNLSQRARFVFPGYGPARNVQNSQPPHYTGSPDTPTDPISFDEVSYSASSPYGEAGQNRSKTGKEGEANDPDLAGRSSGAPPEIFNSPKYGKAEDPGPILQNKPAPLYSGDRKSPSSQPENLPSQTNSNPVGDYQPSPQSPNLKFGFLPANRQQNQSDTNAIGTIENNFSQTRVNGEGFSGEQMPKAPEYWSSEKTKENLSGQKGQNFKISPFQNEIDINRSGVDYRPWPELPEETPVENEATNWQLVRRKLEHLRRLDEEQRGTYGAGSLFN